LSNPEKRKEYDTYGSQAFKAKFSQEDIFRGFNFNDVYDMGISEGIFGRLFGGFGNFGLRGGRGTRSRVFHFGGDEDAFAPAQSFKGADLQVDLPLTLHEMAFGAEKLISFNRDGQLEKVTVKIPPGTMPGKKLRLAEKGRPGPKGGNPGDLFVKLKEVEHPVFKREGNDLYVDRHIRFTEAALGTKVTVPTLDGKTMSLKVPAGTASHTKMRLKNYGLPFPHGKLRGDQFVRIVVDIPANPTRKQRALLEELAREGL
jgi:curved DNA-binding protein